MNILLMYTNWHFLEFIVYSYYIEEILQAQGKWYDGNVDLHIGLRSIGQGQYVNKCKTLKIVLIYLKENDHLEQK